MNSSTQSAPFRAETVRFNLQTVLLAGALVFAQAALAGETLHSVAEDTGISTWETETDGVDLRLTQITPNQARAFMEARGLDPKSVDEFARTCVFMTVLRNDSKKPINYCLAQWRYVAEDGAEQVMLTKHDWMAYFNNRLSPRAELAFQWAQFPVEQTYYPGDWNQGMLAFDLPPGSSFDVIYRWQQGKSQHQGVLKNVQCTAPASAH